MCLKENYLWCFADIVYSPIDERKAICADFDTETVYCIYSTYSRFAWLICDLSWFVFAESTEYANVKRHPNLRLGKTWSVMYSA